MKYYILGGGISGLVSAYELLKRGQSVEIIEKDKILGGLAKSITWKDQEIDLGPHIYHTPDNEIKNYWDNEFPGLLHERDHWSKNFKDNKYYDYPISYEFIENLPKELKNQINNELKLTKEEKNSKPSNYYEYMNNLVGPTLQEMFFIKYPEKLWGISTKQLDSNWAPKRINFRDKSTPFYYGQYSAVGNNGSGTIIKSLKDKILNLGGIINTNEEIQELINENDEVKFILTNKRSINIDNYSKLVNTLSITNVCKLLNIKTDIKYRGVILVYFEINKDKFLPNNVDFIYIDSEEYIFHRLSDQNSFLKNKMINKTIVCCEVAYQKNDHLDNIQEDLIIEKTKNDLIKLNLIKNNDLIDSKLIKIPEVYPMYSVGYRVSLANTKNQIEKLNNMHSIGSLAEFAYSDLQILFSKGIDLAEQLVNKSNKNLNYINKNFKKLNFNQVVEINKIKIGSNFPAYIIAEIGLNHNGNIQNAYKLIDKAQTSGVNAVKLQTYKSSNRSSENGKTSKYVEKILGIEETDYEMFKKNELTIEETKKIFSYARDKGLTIFSTPFDEESVDILEELDVDCYKIASFDIVNLRLLIKVAKCNKPIIISTGMSNLSEIENALNIINLYNQNVIVLQCTSAYPCPPNEMNISAIDTIKRAFNYIPVGLSDHSVGTAISLAAVARGANVIEKHYTLDKNMEGPDHILSLEPHELKLFCKEVREIESSIGNGIKEPSSSEYNTMLRFRKSMYSNKLIKKGQYINFEDITYKGPAHGLSSQFEEFVIGRIARYEIAADTAITMEMIGGYE